MTNYSGSLFVDVVGLVITSCIFIFVAPYLVALMSLPSRLKSSSLFMVCNNWWLFVTHIHRHDCQTASSRLNLHCSHKDRFRRQNTSTCSVVIREIRKYILCNRSDLLCTGRVVSIHHPLVINMGRLELNSNARHHTR